MILKQLTDPEKKKDLMFNKIINIKCVNISFKFFVFVFRIRLEGFTF